MKKFNEASLYKDLFLAWKMTVCIYLWQPEKKCKCAYIRGITSEESRLWREGVWDVNPQFWEVS